MIIQIIGLPGAGKTALAAALADRINAIHFNADEVRADLNSDLGFSSEARVEQARRMGALARLTSKQGYITVVDFICPTEQTRTAFGKPDILIWVNRIEAGRYEDTNKLWENPANVDLVILDGLTVEQEVDDVRTKYSGIYNDNSKQFISSAMEINTKVDKYKENIYPKNNVNKI
jgi:hypothetical protein